MRSTSAGPTESQLIRLAADGDARAIRTLYDRYAPRVYAVVRRIAGDDDRAQDYAQEAWIRAIRALPTFRGDARFSTWLHRIAVNAALQALRKAETRTKREAPVPDQVPVAPAKGDSLLQRKLERALDGLPEGMRRVLILHDVEGYTHEEIGDVLGVTAGTSKSQLFKARAKMREMLAGLSGAAQEHGAEAWSI
jgi:RNA polymerase sigma-70 factor (ECF subfamily)